MQILLPLIISHRFYRLFSLSFILSPSKCPVFQVTDSFFCRIESAFETLLNSSVQSFVFFSFRIYLGFDGFISSNFSFC